MATIRFIHTADWQLGMTRHYLGEEAQGLFGQARLDAIRRVGRVAAQRKCEFIVVSGDVFETNLVNRRTVLRALEALESVPVPVFLLPGNHDPLEAASVYRSPAFLERKPAQVHVLDSTDPLEVRPGVEVVGVPWTSKRPLSDLVARACAALEPAAGTVRVMVAHGAVDTLSPSKLDPALIALAPAERAIAEGRIQYLALGDRHSVTQVGSTGRIWFSGTPEPTDFDEVDPGQVLVVEAGTEAASVTRERVGTWRFIRKDEVHLDRAEDLDALEQDLAAMQDKERTILKLGFIGALPIRLKARLDTILDHAREVFAAVEQWDRVTELSVRPDDEDFSDLALAGFAAKAVERLRRQALGAGPEALEAREALALLVRLQGRAA